MRIAFVVHDARPGGGQDRYALQLVNGLAARHDVTLFARSAEGLDARVRYERIDTPNRPPPLVAAIFVRRVRDRLGSAPWDVVHTIGGAYPGASVLTAQYCHAGWIEAEDRWPSALVGPVEFAYRRLASRLAMRDERRAATHAALRAIIAVSQRTGREWTEAYQPSAPVAAIVPNGVDADRFRPATPPEREALRRGLGLPAGVRLLLTVGALVRKGIETALEVLTSLPDAVHLVALGAGPVDRIEQLAASRNVSSRVHLHAPSNRVDDYFRAADVFVFPTRYEPFGMVVAEAWASGLPVVTGSATGAAEWATDGKDAIVIPDPSDAQGFADAIRRVLNDRPLADGLAQHGLRLASSMTWQRVVVETESVYARFAAEGP